MTLRERLSNFLKKVFRKKLPEAENLEKELKDIETATENTSSQNSSFAESLRDDNDLKSYEDKLRDIIEKYQRYESGVEERSKEEISKIHSKDDVLKTVLGAVLERKGVARAQIIRWFGDLTKVGSFQPILWPVVYAKESRTIRRSTNIDTNDR